MTVFNEQAKKPETEGTWFPFVKSHFDKKKNDELLKRLGALAMKAVAENRSLNAEELVEEGRLKKEIEATIVFDDPEEGAAEFCIRSLIPYFTELMKARKKKYQFVLNTATRAMERVGFYEELTAEDQQKESDNAVDYAITGVRNANIELTRENKLKLVAGSIRREGADEKEFDRFFGRCIKLIADLQAQEAEATEKN